jgi:hypothetical protein
MRWARIGGLAALTYLVGASTASAQVTTTGTIQVTVEDQAAARVPGATVTANAPDVVTSRTAVTDDQGMAALEALAPSALYSVKVELAGFQEQTRTNIIVRSGQTASLRFQLSISGVAEQVQVTADSPVVDVRSATTGQDITLQLTESLPTGRSYQSYLQLVPGVLPDDQTRSGNPAARSGVNYSDIAGNLGESSDEER